MTPSGLDELLECRPHALPRRRRRVRPANRSPPRGRLAAPRRSREWQASASSAAPMVRLIPLRPWASIASRAGSRDAQGVLDAGQATRGPTRGTTPPARGRIRRRRRRRRPARPAGGRPSGPDLRPSGIRSAPRRAAGRLREGGLQVGPADRLGQIAVEAGVEAALAVALHGVRGQREDRHVAARVRPRRARIARTASKPSISGICTSMRTRSKSRPRRAPQRPRAVGRDDDRVPQALEHPDGHLLVDRMVLGQQDAAAAARSAAVGDAGPAADSPRRRSPGTPRHQDLHQGVEELGLPDRLGQAGGDPQGAVDARHPPGARRRSSSRTGSRRSRARRGSAGPGRTRPSRASCRRAARRRTAGPPRRRRAVPPVASAAADGDRRPGAPARAGPPPGSGGWWRCRPRSGSAAPPAGAAPARARPASRRRSAGRPARR